MNEEKHHSLDPDFAFIRKLCPQFSEHELREANATSMDYLSARGIVQCGGPDRAVPRTLDGDFDDAASSPPEPDSSRLDAFFETLVAWLKKNPDAFAQQQQTYQPM
jgi:hypothetical protein